MKSIRNAHPSTSTQKIGFIGLGSMGQPIALNLVRAGFDLTVWNRTPAAAIPLQTAGAIVASTSAEVFAKTDIILCMLVNETALDAVLQRHTNRFAQSVAGKLIVCMGTNPAAYSSTLSDDIIGAGGRYVEAPVSGSTKPALEGKLIGLVGGRDEDVARIYPLLTPLCREIIHCGQVGDAMRLKLAVNVFVATTLASLAEAVHLAEQQGLDPFIFKAAIDAGQMDCDLTRTKLPKLITGDFALQAATNDAVNVASMGTRIAQSLGIELPLLNAARDLYRKSAALGYGKQDMTSVIKAIEEPNAIDSCEAM